MNTIPLCIPISFPLADCHPTGVRCIAAGLGLLELPKPARHVQLVSKDLEELRKCLP